MTKICYSNMIHLLSAAATAVFLSFSPSQADDTVIIAIGNEPPYTEIKSDGTLTGAGPDIDQAALEGAGIKNYKGEVMEYGAMIPALQARRVSLVSSGGLVINSERCKQVIYSEPVICSAEAFLMRKETIGQFDGYKSAADANAKLGVPSGSVQEKAALAAGVKQENLVPYPDGPSAVKMLIDKRIDAIALNDSAVLEMQKRYGNDSLQPLIPIADGPISCAGAAFNKEDVALRDQYNEGLKKMIESGKFLEIMKGYGLEENAKLLGKRTTAQLCGNQ